MKKKKYARRILFWIFIFKDLSIARIEHESEDEQSKKYPKESTATITAHSAPVS